jgi:hypothetical protein
MTLSKSFVFRFDDVEVREREFSLTKAGKVLSVEPKAFRVDPLRGDPRFKDVLKKVNLSE